MIDSADEFVRLRTSEDRQLYTRAANDNAPEEVWQEIVERFPDMREWVAHNKTVPITILEQLAEDSNSKVRWVVAQKRRLSAAIMDRLSHDPDETVRLRIAMNPSTPEEILARMLDDSWPRIVEIARRRLKR